MCSICNSIVEMKVYHCDTCDLCCEGFSHHCDWVGKCIGYRNNILLKGYFYGYIVGLLFMILIVAFILWYSLQKKSIKTWTILCDLMKELFLEALIKKFILYLPRKLYDSWPNISESLLFIHFLITIVLPAFFRIYFH